MDNTLKRYLDAIIRCISDSDLFNIIEFWFYGW
jgi:hypothetical protein